MSKNVYAVKITNRKFEVVTPQRIYYFKGLDSASTDEWVNAINDTIKEHCSN